MPARLVHDPKAESQRLGVVPLDEFVDRSGIGQRRQPHSVGAYLARRQLVEDDLAQHPLFGFAYAVTRSASGFSLNGHWATGSAIGAAVNWWIRTLLAAACRGAASPFSDCAVAGT